MPTPRDMAQRARSPQFTAPVAQAPAVAPTPQLPFRLRWERAIRRSSLPANARHVALTVATYGDYITGVIPASAYPSLTTLAKDTSLPPSLTRGCLRVLVAGGWIRQTPPARTPHAPGGTELLLPARVATTPPDSPVH